MTQIKNTFEAFISIQAIIIKLSALISKGQLGRSKDLSADCFHESASAGGSPIVPNTNIWKLWAQTKVTIYLRILGKISPE